MNGEERLFLRQLMALDKSLHSFIERLTEQSACGHPEAVIVETWGGTEHSICPRCNEVDGAA